MTKTPWAAEAGWSLLASHVLPPRPERTEAQPAPRHTAEDEEERHARLFVFGATRCSRPIRR